MLYRGKWKEREKERKTEREKEKQKERKKERKKRKIFDGKQEEKKGVGSLRMELP